MLENRLWVPTEHFLKITGEETHFSYSMTMVYHLKQQYKNLLLDELNINFTVHLYCCTFGANFWNSLTQLFSVDRGAATRKGPLTPISIKCANSEMHCSVLPRPISSAKMPFIPFS